MSTAQADESALDVASFTRSPVNGEPLDRGLGHVTRSSPGRNGRGKMGLSDAKVEPAIPVSDIAKAREFYEGKLGLSGGRNIGDGGITYPCGAGRAIHLYPSPSNAGKSGGTIAAWEVDDLERTVDELTANGVTFQQVDSGRIKTNEKGIAALGEDRMAWFSDPDGNVFGIAQL